MKKVIQGIGRPVVEASRGVAIFITVRGYISSRSCPLIEISQFLGFASYNCQSIKRFAQVATPLHS